MHDDPMTTTAPSSSWHYRIDVNPDPRPYIPGALVSHDQSGTWQFKVCLPGGRSVVAFWCQGWAFGPGDHYSGHYYPLRVEVPGVQNHYDLVRRLARIYFRDESLSPQVAAALDLLIPATALLVDGTPPHPADRYRTGTGTNVV